MWTIPKVQFRKPQLKVPSSSCCIEISQDPDQEECNPLSRLTAAEQFLTTGSVLTSHIMNSGVDHTRFTSYLRTPGYHVHKHPPNKDLAEWQAERGPVSLPPLFSQFTVASSLKLRPGLLSKFEGKHFSMPMDALCTKMLSRVTTGITWRGVPIRY